MALLLAPEQKLGVAASVQKIIDEKQNRLYAAEIGIVAAYIDG
tara:strand:+ start:112 stop:240 length:129 start_codon:yes stop_codon:yes gene_type:complete